MNDEELVKAFRKGDGDAFSELVNRHARGLTMMALRLVDDPEEAKDISQATFLKAFEKLSGFMMASSFKTWLYRIAVNTARDHLRRRKVRPTVELDMEIRGDDCSAQEMLEKRNSNRMVREAVEELPEKQRLTLKLRMYEEMEYREIAKVIGGTEGAARANFFQALKSLRRRLGDGA